MKNVESAKVEPTFAPMVSACAAHGVSRTVAFELARNGLIENFAIGTRRYVVLQSLRDLPERLKTRGQKAAA